LESRFCNSLSGGTFGGNRGARPVPPEKGVFPLDHLHECDQVLLFLSLHLMQNIYLYLEAKVDSYGNAFTGKEGIYSMLENLWVQVRKM
jgi:hypothetical protein